MGDDYRGYLLELMLTKLMYARTPCEGLDPADGEEDGTNGAGLQARS